jgi:putative ABC transport system substrate-binding protein
MNLDIIVAPASTEVEPVLHATKTIPIVFCQHADPVGLGHVASLAHPGGNVTGVSMVLTEIAAKTLQILKDAVPQAERIAVVWNPSTPSHITVLKEVEVVGKRLVFSFSLSLLKLWRILMEHSQRWSNKELTVSSLRVRP